MGGAQPLSRDHERRPVCLIAAEVDEKPASCKSASRARYLDRHGPATPIEAIAWAKAARSPTTRRSRSVSCANAAELLRARPWPRTRHHSRMLVTDQTSAHDMLGGYVPAGMSLDAAASPCAKVRPPRAYTGRARAPPIVRTRSGLMNRASWSSGADHLRLRQQHVAARPPTPDSRRRRPRFPRVRAGLHPAAVFCEGKGPFRWVALSGDPEDIYRYG